MDSLETAASISRYSLIRARRSQSVPQRLASSRSLSASIGSSTGTDRARGARAAPCPPHGAMQLVNRSCRMAAISAHAPLLLSDIEAQRDPPFRGFDIAISSSCVELSYYYTSCLISTGVALFLSLFSPFPHFLFKFFKFMFGRFKRREYKYYYLHYIHCIVYILQKEKKNGND